MNEVFIGQVEMSEKDMEEGVGRGMRFGREDKSFQYLASGIQVAWDSAILGTTSNLWIVLHPSFTDEQSVKSSTDS